MTKIIFISFCLLFLFIPTLFAQETEGKKGWPPVERSSFITECINSAKVGMSEDSARFYCYCMLEKIEKKYPVIQDANKFMPAEMDSPEWKKEIRSCITGISKWSNADRSEFLLECIIAAKDGLNEEKAKSYCTCMMFQIEKLYPNAADVGEITEEKLKTPEWKKLVRMCLDF